MRAADWAHYIAATVLMYAAFPAVESWPLGVLVLVAYFAAIGAETWLYHEARAQQWAADDLRAAAAEAKP